LQNALSRCFDDLAPKSRVRDARIFEVLVLRNLGRARSSAVAFMSRGACPSRGTLTEVWVEFAVAGIPGPYRKRYLRPDVRCRNWWK
jgi:hypothetical protein